MAKFAGKRKPMAKTKNYEGAPAFVHSDEATLLNLVSTCFMGEPKFYGQPGEVEKKILKLAMRTDPKFVLQLSAYARGELYLRSVPMYLLCVTASRPEGKKHVRGYTPKIVNRADELYESVACYLNTYGKPLPNSLKKGVADSFVKFDEYQLAKYDRPTGLTLKDVMCLTHPAQPRELLQKIHDGTLATPMTWETQISARGNRPEVWEELIEKQKLPYMATLRNLRNLLTTGEKGISDRHLDMVIKYLKNAKAVRGAKQFPFRYLAAYRELGYGTAEASYGYYGYYGPRAAPIAHPRVSDVMDALDRALYISYGNIPHMDGTAFITTDVSGSMQSPVSKNSKIQCIDIGMLLASATHKYTDRAIVGVFGTEFKTVNIPKKTSGIIANIPRMIQTASTVGHATNGHLAVKYLNDHGIFVDRILMFTDMQLWNTHMYAAGGDTINKQFQRYRERVNPNVRFYLVNVNGYGTTTFPEHDRSVVNIHGWSDKILKFIQMNETDAKVQLNYIKSNY